MASPRYEPSTYFFIFKLKIVLKVYRNKVFSYNRCQLEYIFQAIVWITIVTAAIVLSTKKGTHYANVRKAGKQ